MRNAKKGRLAWRLVFIPSISLRPMRRETTYIQAAMPIKANTLARRLKPRKRNAAMQCNVISEKYFINYNAYYDQLR